MGKILFSCMVLVLFFVSHATKIEAMENGENKHTVSIKSSDDKDAAEALHKNSLMIVRSLQQENRSKQRRKLINKLFTMITNSKKSFMPVFSAENMRVLFVHFSQGELENFIEKLIAYLKKNEGQSDHLQAIQKAVFIGQEFIDAIMPLVSQPFRSSTSSRVKTSSKRSRTPGTLNFDEKDGRRDEESLPKKITLSPGNYLNSLQQAIETGSFKKDLEGLKRLGDAYSATVLVGCD